MEINADFRAKMWTDTEANWLSSDPVPLAGEILLTSDKNELRFGDNVKKYSELEAISGGGLGTISIPQPKTWVEKWTGSQATKLNEWSTGKYKIVIKDTTTRKYSFDLVLEDLTISTYANQSSYVAGGSNGSMIVYYDTADNTFKIVDGLVVTDTIEAIYRWELDPDNIALVTVPSDPSLIKDWVEVYENLTNTDQQITLPVADGRYEVLVHDDATKAIIYTCEVVIDNGLTTCKTPWAEADNLSYTVSTGVWDTHDAAWAIRRIRRWEDVAGADAQMNPPVDGWEQKFYDYTNTANVTNSWGDGTYKFVIRRSDNAVTVSCFAHLNTVDGVGNLETTQGGGPDQAKVRMSGSTFQTNSVSGTYYIAEIHKFNSLVNVLHSYHPDPRQVAQKDWVTVYDEPANTGNVLNIWGTGTFIFYSKLSSGAAGTCVLQLDDLNQTTYSAAPDTTAYRVSWNFATNTFIPAGATYEIIKILKWEDSQASDAPRTVLDDGYETLWEDDTATSITKTLAVGNGDYAVDMFFNGNSFRYNCDISINNGILAANAAFGTANELRYTVATGVWDAVTAGFYIRRIRKITGKVVLTAQYNVTALSDGPNQVFSINTDAGDINKTLPSSPGLGDLYEVWNTGSNGYHVNITTDGSTLYNGLAIGDRKGIRLRYVDGWKYEDVIIDEYVETDGTSSDVDHLVTKWSGGKMKINSSKDATLSTNRVCVFPVAYTRLDSIAGQGVAGIAYLTAKSITGITFTSATLAGGALAAEATIVTEGRWKTGV